MNHYSPSYYLRSGTLKMGADMFTHMIEGVHKLCPSNGEIHSCP